MYNAIGHNIKETAEAATLLVLDRIQSIIQVNVARLDSRVTNDNTLITNLTTQYAQLNNQVQQILLSTQTGNSQRQPKMAEPPKFSGESKVKFGEWKDWVLLWFSHKNVIMDKQQITMALAHLTSSAACYMKPWIERLESGQTIGTWDKFIQEMKVQYSQRNEKEGAKNEITALFKNKTLASKNFIDYCKKFCTLGCICGYQDNFMINKLDRVMEDLL
jgi:hypothetical protein